MLVGRGANPTMVVMSELIVAAVQTSPVFLDREATVEKVIGLIHEAAQLGAGLVVFPETFIPTYPDWVWRTTPWDQAATDLYRIFFEQSVVVPSDVTERLGQAAAENGCYVSIGVNERDEHGSTIYNTQLTFSSDGELVARHRKLMPTGGERLVWGMGDGSTLDVIDTPFGRLGGLTCWENYMPLARAALYAQGIDVYVAPTWDNSDSWVASMRHIAKEGRVYVVGVNFCLRESDIPEDLPHRDELYKGDEYVTEGNSVIVGPDGDVLAGPLVGSEGILTAKIDIGHARALRFQFDPVGHYGRPDVLRLVVDRSANRSVSFDS